MYKNISLFLCGTAYHFFFNSVWNNIKLHKEKNEGNDVLNETFSTRYRFYFDRLD